MGGTKEQGLAIDLQNSDLLASPSSSHAFDVRPAIFDQLGRQVGTLFVENHLSESTAANFTLSPKFLPTPISLSL